MAEWLDAGMLVFLHKTTGEVVNYPDELEFSDVEDMWEDVTGKIEADRDSYIAFEPMPSSQAFRIMESFIAGIDDVRTGGVFTTAISQRKLFRHFNDLLHSYPGLRQEWFVYKAERYFEYVKDEIDFAFGSDDD
nr:UPF0158 family protein [Mucilaginibacter celer]